MRLLIVRHGATANNAEARYTGQSDVPLSPLGERQVEAVARALADVRLDAIISSDLVRARSTAEAIARYHQVPVLLDPDLREIAIGAWEGLTYAEALRRDPSLVAAWQSGRPESLGLPLPVVRLILRFATGWLVRLTAGVRPTLSLMTPFSG